VKIYMDGSGAGRTAWVYHDWYKNGHEPDVGNSGYPLIEPGLYREVVKLYHAAGIHVGTHAVGDRAIDWVVDTYAAVLKERPGRGVRHAIIHANIPSAHAIAVMRALERSDEAGYPETQPPFIWWIGDNYAANLGPERLGRLNPYHSYLEQGIRWAAGSDYPVTPLPARYGLWASVARTTRRGTYGAQPFGTAESVDIRTALRSYTIWAAHQLFLERESGSLELGKSADIAVWDRDLSSVATDALKDLKCEMTLFRGRVVYRAPRSPVMVRSPR
jgi:predicted amidohydrolase YtcJ